MCDYCEGCHMNDKCNSLEFFFVEEAMYMESYLENSLIFQAKENFTHT